jgi:hypothetical protein
MNEPVLDAIADHRNMDVRLKAVHLLACAGEPETFEQLRQLAIRDGIGEEVKTALLEAMYKLDQARLKDDEAMGVLALDRQSELEASEEEAGYRPFQSQSAPAFETEVPPNLEEFGL